MFESENLTQDPDELLEFGLALKAGSGIHESGGQGGTKQPQAEDL